jgi:hypothetical protein
MDSSGANGHGDIKFPPSLNKGHTGKLLNSALGALWRSIEVELIRGFARRQTPANLPAG